jgi:hypothetical protein
LLLGMGLRLGVNAILIERTEHAPAFRRGRLIHPNYADHRKSDGSGFESAKSCDWETASPPRRRATGRHCVRGRMTRNRNLGWSSV